MYGKKIRNLVFLSAYVVCGDSHKIIDALVGAKRSSSIFWVLVPGEGTDV